MLDRGAPKSDAYWVLATLGEAALVKGELDRAHDRFGEATRLGVDKRRWADIATTRKQARFILEQCGRDASSLDDCFRIPQVVVFAGHRIDSPGRSIPRFPPDLEEKVRRGITERLSALDAGIAYSAAACGSDILFLELMIERQAEINIVLPFDVQDFRSRSVTSAGSGGWIDRFDKVLRAAARVVNTARFSSSESGLEFTYCDRVSDGLAKMRADFLDTQLVCLAVIEPASEAKRGGTVARVREWQRRSWRVEEIDLTQLRTGESAPTGPRHLAPETQLDRQELVLLFADAVSYSKLAEDQFPIFSSRFLSTVATTIERNASNILFRRTSGDGLFLVLPDIRSAGNVALDMCERLTQVDWEAVGLPPNLQFRIGLHAGPIYAYQDPITGRTDFCGEHVNRAARIEPIAPPGNVYASEAFAALAAVENVGEFVCEYVGQQTLPKGHGVFPTYHLRRS